jgi:hypothetical protein
VSLRLKAAKSPRNPKNDAFQELWEMGPWTKGSNNPRNQKTVAFLDYGVIYAELSLRNAACDIVFFGFTYYNSQRAKSLRYMHYEVKHKI